jgi:c-di-GMP-binding flagellar brake protein YcgR
MSEDNPEAESEQRRQHVRVDLSRRCAVKLRGKPTIGCELTDLSGTGCGFRINARVDLGDHGTIRISFDDWTLDTPFTVRFVKQESPLMWLVGVNFDALLRTEVDQVVREVFTELRRQIRAQRTVD